MKKKHEEKIEKEPEELPEAPGSEEEGSGESDVELIDYPVDSTALTEPLNGSRADLFFGDKIKDGQCTFFVYDSAGIVRRTTVDIHQTDSLQDIVNTINNAGTGVPNLTASIEDGKLKLVADNGYSFAFGEDSSGAMAALGLNTFFDGGRGRDISINQLIRSL